MTRSRFNLSCGAEQLASAPGTNKQKADALGVTERSIVNYSNGSRVPTDAVQGKAERAYGITREAWTTAATASIRPNDAPSASDGPTVPALASSSLEASSGPGSIAEIDTQLARLNKRRESGQLSERAMLETEKLIAMLNRDRARLLDVDPDLFRASDVYRKTVDDTWEALRGRFVSLYTVTDTICGTSHLDGLRARFPVEVAAVERAEQALMTAMEKSRAARELPPQVDQ